MPLFLAALTGYFLGSLPAGFLAGKIAGVDIRTIGSGNIGATNVVRMVGKKFGYPVFAVDLAKGLIAALLGMYFGRRSGAQPDFIELCGVVGGSAAVIGHSFPIWLGFKGGKGVATSIGVLFGLNWIAAIVVCVVWCAIFKITRYVSVASMVAAAALPVTFGALLLFHRLETTVLLYFSFCLAALVIFRHRSNLSRLLNGTEPRALPK